MEPTDLELAEIESESDSEWSPLLRRELVQTGFVLLTYLAIKIALDLTDEHSTLRWKLHRVWHDLMRQISGDEENRAIALVATRGIAYAQVWLDRQWRNRKEETNGNA